jgi:hypothetical protein
MLTKDIAKVFLIRLELAFGVELGLTLMQYFCIDQSLCLPNLPAFYSAFSFYEFAVILPLNRICFNLFYICNFVLGFCSMAGRQVLDVPPMNVGGSPFCIAVSTRGMDIQKVS